MITLLAVLFALLAAASALARDLSIPDPAVTAGAVTEMTVDVICATKWGKDARHVTAPMKREVLERYGLKGNTCKPDKHGRHCEIDHLISREVGGADDVLNLWPQPYGGRWGASMKDRLENRLHKEVCAGNLTLEQARSALLDDWRTAYEQYFGTLK